MSLGCSFGGATVCGSGGLSGGSTIACLGLCNQIYFGVKITPDVPVFLGCLGVYFMGC